MSDVLVAVLLVFSGLLALTGALGLVRLPDYFLRMHAPSLAYTLGSWSVTLASIIYFSVRDGSLSLHVWVVVLVLCMTAPVTTVLLTRAALFRGRQAGEALPPPLLGEGP